MKAPICQRVSVVLPAFNEADHIANSIHEVHRVLCAFCSDFEIIVVDDGSRDDTLPRAVESAREFCNVHVKPIPHNVGKGWAMREGFYVASGDLIVFLDADLDIHPAQIKLLFNIMESTGADVVIGSKRHPQSKLEYPLSRRLLSAGYFFMVKILFGLPIRDTQTGLKLFRSHVLQDILPCLVVKQFAFDLELLANAHRRGYKIAEAPVILQHLRIKLSPVGLHSAKNIFLDTMGILCRLRITRYYDRYPNVSPEETRGVQLMESLWLAARHLYRRYW